MFTLYKLPQSIKVSYSQNKVIFENTLTKTLEINYIQEKDFVVNNENTIIFNELKPFSLKKRLDRDIKGLTLGFKYELELLGIGYRSNLIENSLNLRIGFSHDILLKIPENIEIFLESEKLIILFSHDYELLTNFSKKLINLRPINKFTGQGIQKKGSKTKIQKNKK